jgi:hypothetical protein
LELAKKVKSKSTTVIQARQDPDFRAKGLLPQFTAANQKISSSAQQVQLPSVHYDLSRILSYDRNTPGAKIFHSPQRVYQKIGGAQNRRLSGSSQNHESVQVSDAPAPSIMLPYFFGRALLTRLKHCRNFIEGMYQEKK